MTGSLSPAQRRQRVAAATVHGARSPKEVSKRSAYEQQRILKPLHLRQRDLEPADRYLLRQWAILQAQVTLMDRWVNERGLLDEAGRPPAFTATYHAARNAAIRTFRALEPRLLKASRAKAERVDALEAHLRAHYGEGDS